jgi:hypothetical protein
VPLENTHKGDPKTHNPVPQRPGSNRNPKARPPQPHVWSCPLSQDLMGASQDAG